MKDGINERRLHTNDQMTNEQTVDVGTSRQ